MLETTTYQLEESDSINTDRLKSIHFRDKLYRKCKSLNPETTDYVNAKINFKVYNGILSRNIRLAKHLLS